MIETNYFGAVRCVKQVLPIGWRSALSDEDWVGLGGLKNDADYFQRVFTDTGVDLRQI